MLKAAIKSLLAHKTRLALTALSVILGVAFVAGTFIYTDTTNDAFDGVFATAYEGVDVYVSGESEFSMGQGVFFDESVAADVAAVPGVARVDPAIFGMGVQILDSEGETIGGNGPPQMGIGVPSEGDSVSTGTVLREGRIPSGAGEVAIDAGSARTGEFVMGDEIEIVTPTAPVQRFELVGIIGFGEVDNLAGATFAVFDLVTGQELLGRPGMISEINIATEPGADLDEVIASVQSVLPEGARAQSAQSAADEAAAEIQEALGFFGKFLLVFAFIALFVGSFIIYNTFRIVITQRMRELALMRAIGSTRSQVVRTVLLEALLVGLVASAIGVVAGLGLAVGLRAVLDAVGVALPAGSLILAPRTVVIGLTLGVVVTTLSALFPAIAASRVPPVAAMRADEVAPTERSMRMRAIVGGLVLVAGAVLIVSGLNNDTGNTTVALSSVGFGALVMILGAYALSALVARPVAAVIGAPFARLFGVSGKLAQRNAGRSPRRTSATSGAIMVGIALIALAAIMSASLQATIDDIFSQGVEADVLVTPAEQFALSGYTPELAGRITELPEVAAITRVPVAPVLIDGSETFLGALDDNFEEFFPVEVVEGSVELGPGVVIASESAATDNDLVVGDQIDMVFEETGTQSFTVGGVFTSDAIDGFALGRSEFETNFAVETDNQIYIQLVDGVTPEEGRDAVAAVAEDVPSANVQTVDEWVDSIADQVNSLLGLITGLLGMTVLVALIGVTNTMALAVYERTREIGLLRAVGLGRVQTRRMIRLEASIISAFGAILGVGLGLFFGWAVLQALADEGFTSFVVPWVMLAVWVTVTALLGVLFALWPAWRASKLNVLEAISYE